MKRVLIVRTDRIGDVVMATPIVREIRRQFPDAFIATLTQPHTRDIFLHNPYVNVCLSDDLTKESFWPIVRELRSHRFTDGLLLLPTERAAYQMFLGGVRNRITVGHKLYGVLTFMKGVSRNNYTPLRHEADYSMDLARKIGIAPTDITPEIFVTDEEKARAISLLRNRGVHPGGTMLFLHTGTLGSSPNWSEPRYVTLVKSLLMEFRDPSFRVLLTAREMTRDFLNEVISFDKERVIDISSEITGVREFIRFMSVASILVAPSTGPAHIADALNIPCVVIHCHRSMSCVRHWGILNKRSINLEVAAADCRRLCSADQKSCGIDAGISPESVVQSVRQLIASEL
jgi:heptosyltransferase-2